MTVLRQGQDEVRVDRRPLSAAFAQSVGDFINAIGRSGHAAKSVRRAKRRS